MLKVIDSKLNMPFNYPVNKRIGQLQPGMFGQIRREKAVVSDGTNPCGLIDDVKSPCENTIMNGRLTMWVTPGTYQTDQYERNGKYAKDAELFVSQNGKLTSRHRKGTKAIGKVVRVESGRITFEYYGWSEYNSAWKVKDPTRG